jgi:cystathionine beta-lyase/cystathionine gamma-synthase
MISTAVVSIVRASSTPHGWTRIPFIDGERTEVAGSAQAQYQDDLIETPTNPTLRLVDIVKTAAIAKCEVFSPLSTIRLPWIQRPLNSARMSPCTRPTTSQRSPDMLGGMAVTADNELVSASRQ